MGKRLTDNLNSLYIGAANDLRPKRARRKIVAYVESYDDVSFWRSILGEYEDDSRYFEVMLPSRNTLARGKKSVLMNQLGKRLGQNMIACVDSDYDYLLQGCTSTSRYMLNSPYVMQTYAYAIENFHCYAEGLHEVCVMATLNDRVLIDFPAFFRLYSQIAYPLFVWSIWFYRKQNLSEFSLLDFCSFVRIDKLSTRFPAEGLDTMARKVNRKVKDLKRKHPEAEKDLAAMEKEFARLGVFPENTYMFIQGHHIMNNVTLRLLNPICATLRREREEQINRLALHEIQRQNELTAYRRSQMDVEQLLHKNTNYKNSPLYKMIQRDIEQFLKS